MMYYIVDIDGTINRFQEYVYYILENLGYTMKRCSSFDIVKCIQHKNRKKIFSDLMASKEFWMNIPLQENAYQGLLYLFQNAPTIIATTPWDEGNKEVKLQYMYKKLDFIPKDHIIFHGQKWELKRPGVKNIIIEDKPETLEKCRHNGFITIKVAQPYNRDVESSYELYSWKDITSIHKDIIRRWGE